MVGARFGNPDRVIQVCAAVSLVLDCSGDDCGSRAVRHLPQSVGKLPRLTVFELPAAAVRKRSAIINSNVSAGDAEKQERRAFPAGGGGRRPEHPDRSNVS